MILSLVVFLVMRKVYNSALKNLPANRLFYQPFQKGIISADGVRQVTELFWF